MAEQKQWKSWPSVYGVKEYPDLVAQTFFPTANCLPDAADQSAGGTGSS